MYIRTERSAMKSNHVGSVGGQNSADKSDLRHFQLLAETIERKEEYLFALSQGQNRLQILPEMDVQIIHE